MEEGNNSSFENKKRKLLLARKSLIKCSRCPYNQKDNAKRKDKASKYKNINRESIRYIEIEDEEGENI